MWVVIFILIIVCLILAVCFYQQRAQLVEYRKSDEMKSTFIKALAREIRTPLHSVSGMAEIISNEGLYLSKEEKKNISDQILYNARLITTLLDEVTIYSDGNSDGHQLQDERFSPNRLCQTCIDANLSNAKLGVRISFHRGVGDEFFVSADRHIVELVLNKLIYCSCKFTTKGEIVIGCQWDDPCRLLSFCVEDTGGCNIPEERKAFLFKWFEHPDMTAEETEFDLSVAYRLAEKINGYLRWDDTYTKGMRMVFTLPVR